MNNNTAINQESQASPYKRQEHSILVIHPYDVSTDFLSILYQDLDAVVIRGNVSPSFLAEQISKADQLIALGHGCAEGLLNDEKHLVLDKRHVDLLKSRKHPGIYIWCYAKQFVEKYIRNALFYTDMFISELYEANVFNILTSENQVEYSNAAFAVAIKHALEQNSYSKFYLNVFNEYTKTWSLGSKLPKLIQYNASRFYQTKLADVPKDNVLDFARDNQSGFGSQSQMMDEISRHGSSGTPDEMRNKRIYGELIVVEENQ